MRRSRLNIRPKVTPVLAKPAIKQETKPIVTPVVKGDDIADVTVGETGSDAIPRDTALLNEVVSRKGNDGQLSAGVGKAGNVETIVENVISTLGKFTALEVPVTEVVGDRGVSSFRTPPREDGGGQGSTAAGGQSDRMSEEENIYIRNDGTDVSVKKEKARIRVNIDPNDPLSSLPPRLPERRINKRINETRKLLSASRRKFANVKGPVDVSKLTMLDLIYYNPPGTPMKKKTLPVIPTNDSEVDGTEKDAEETEPRDGEGQDDKEEDCVGPRVIVGPDGQITIDESSLVIRRQAPDKNKSLLKIKVECAGQAKYTSFKVRKVKKSTWTVRETSKFYRALSICGTDFTLMSTMFPSRSRQDLKNKYKREERVHPQLVDKAIHHPTQFEFTNYELEDIGKDDVMAKPPRRKKSAAKPRAAKRKERSDSVEENELDRSSEDLDGDTLSEKSSVSSSSPFPTPSVTQSARKKRKSRAKKKIEDDDDDFDGDEEFKVKSSLVSNTPSEPVKSRPQRDRRVRVFMEHELEDEEDEEEDEELSLPEEDHEEVEANPSVSNENNDGVRDVEDGSVQQVPEVVVNIDEEVTNVQDDMCSIEQVSEKMIEEAKQDLNISISEPVETQQSISVTDAVEAAIAVLHGEDVNLIQAPEQKQSASLEKSTDVVEIEDEPEKDLVDASSRQDAVDDAVIIIDEDDAAISSTTASSSISVLPPMSPEIIESSRDNVEPPAVCCPDQTSEPPSSSPARLESPATTSTTVTKEATTTSITSASIKRERPSISSQTCAPIIPPGVTAGEMMLCASDGAEQQLQFFVVNKTASESHQAPEGGSEALPAAADQHSQSCAPQAAATSESLIPASRIKRTASCISNPETKPVVTSGLTIVAGTAETKVAVCRTGPLKQEKDVKPRLGRLSRRVRPLMGVSSTPKSQGVNPKSSTSDLTPVVEETPEQTLNTPTHESSEPTTSTSTTDKTYSPVITPAIDAASKLTPRSVTVLPLRRKRISPVVPAPPSKASRVEMAPKADDEIKSKDVRAEAPGSAARECPSSSETMRVEAPEVEDAIAEVAAESCEKVCEEETAPAAVTLTTSPDVEVIEIIELEERNIPQSVREETVEGIENPDHDRESLMLIDEVKRQTQKIDLIIDVDESSSSSTAVQIDDDDLSEGGVMDVTPSEDAETESEKQASCDASMRSSPTATTPEPPKSAPGSPKMNQTFAQKLLNEETQSRSSGRFSPSVASMESGPITRPIFSRERRLSTDSTKSSGSISRATIGRPIVVSSGRAILPTSSIRAPMTMGRPTVVTPIATNETRIARIATPTRVLSSPIIVPGSSGVGNSRLILPHKGASPLVRPVIPITPSTSSEDAKRPPVTSRPSTPSSESDKH